MATILENLQAARKFEKEQLQNREFSHAAKRLATQFAREADRNYNLDLGATFIQGPTWHPERTRWECEVQVQYMRKNGRDKITTAYRIHSDRKEVLPTDVKPGWRDVVSQLRQLRQGK